MLHDCHLPVPQSPARDSACVTVSLRGTETWAAPLATVSFLEVSGFPLHVRPGLLVLGLTLALTRLLLIEPYAASVSSHNIVQCQSQIGSGTQRCWRDCCSSNSGRGAPLLGGRGHHLQKQKSRPPWSKADNAGLVPPWLLPILRSIPLALGEIASPLRKQLSVEAQICGIISDSIGVPSPFSLE